MMRMEVLSEKENLMLKRSDITIFVDHTGKPTPKKDEVTQKIAEKFKVEPEKVEVIFIFSQKGCAGSKIKARIWKEKLPERKSGKKTKKVEGQKIKGKSDET